MSYIEKELTALTMKVGEQPVLEEFPVKEENGTYEIISKAVEGYVEALRLSETCVLWINEEGKLNDLPLNFFLTDRVGNCVDAVVGNVIFTGMDEEGYTRSLSQEDIELIEKLFTSRLTLKYYA